jgi:hypothetical protein
VRRTLSVNPDTSGSELSAEASIAAEHLAPAI